jgi:hypothetical protein
VAGLDDTGVRRLLSTRTGAYTIPSLSQARRFTIRGTLTAGVINDCFGADSTKRRNLPQVGLSSDRCTSVAIETEVKGSFFWGRDMSNTSEITASPRLRARRLAGIRRRVFEVADALGRRAAR